MEWVECRGLWRHCALTWADAVTMTGMVKPSKARRVKRSETVRARTLRTPTDRDVRAAGLRIASLFESSLHELELEFEITMAVICRKNPRAGRLIRDMLKRGEH